jgi:NTP pyrophosphatase (non-canonical NTP hydrolase)
MSVSFRPKQGLRDFQSVIGEIYGLPDDRLYSIWDLLTQQQRFTMRTLKGIRKSDPKKIRTNMLIAMSWAMAVANRLHIDADDEVWKRFPGVCSYCTQRPCVCKALRPDHRKKVSRAGQARPHSLAEIQQMFDGIYPAQSRSVADAGIHLAEEMGEVSEAVHNYLGQHTAKLFEEIAVELADYISCVFGLANSQRIDVAKELAAFYADGCHVCRKAPCVCSFASVIKLKT